MLLDPSRLVLQKGTLTMPASRPADRRTLSAVTAAAIAVLAAVVSLSVPVATVAALPAQPTPTTVAAAPIAPGTVVAAELDLGQLSTIDPQGRATVLVKNLKKPNGVAVLADGSVLVAESGANRVAGIGGRFGPELKTIAEVEFPQGLAVGLDGTVYVTLLLKGEVGKLDLVAGTYTKILGDLKGPGDVAIREGLLYITEGAVDSNDVVRINPLDGTKAVVASGFQQPVGVATGPGQILFVADYKAGKVVKVDDAGKQTDFVKVDAPVQLAIEPYQPVADQPYALIVASKVGVSRYDANGRKVGATAPLKVATGVATVPAVETPPPTTTTTAPPVTVPTTLGTIPPTTRLRPTTTVGVLVDVDAKTTSGNALMVSLLIIGVVAVAIAAFLIVRKPKTMSGAGFEERPLDSHSVAEAFGPCAAQEVELAEAEGGLQSLIIQQESAEKRSADAVERIGVAQARLDAATEAVRIAEEAHVAAGGTLTAGPPALKLDDLGLTTDGGRDALAAFAKGEIDAHELEARWTDLGEHQAIDVVRATGEDEVPAADLPEAVTTAQAELAEAREELETAQMDRDHATFEIPRLQERLDAATARIIEARASLEACQAEHRAGVEKREQAAAAARAGDGAEVATAGDDPDPAGEPAPDDGSSVPVGGAPLRARGKRAAAADTDEQTEAAADDEVARRVDQADTAKRDAAALEAKAAFAKAEQDARDAVAAKQAAEARDAAEREREAATAAAEAKAAKELADAEAEREAAAAREAEARQAEAARQAQAAAEAAAREAEIAKAAQEAAEAKAAAAAEARAARLAEQARREQEQAEADAARAAEQERAERAARLAVLQETEADAPSAPPPTTTGEVAADAEDAADAGSGAADEPAPVDDGDGAPSFDAALNAMFDSALEDQTAPPSTTSSPDATLRLFGDADEPRRAD